MAPSVEKLAQTGVLFTVTSLPTVMNPRRRRKPPVEGRAGPCEASGVRRCYVTLPAGGKGLNDVLISLNLGVSRGSVSVDL